MSTSGQSRYATVNGTNIHYVEWGRQGATPILLLHGLRAYGHWYDDFAEAAKDRYRVIAPDLRGRGASEWAKDADYSTDAYVRDLAGLVDGLGLSRFILGGHSLGGVIVANYTARYPERVAALLILDMTPDVDPAGIQRIRRELAETPEEFASWDEARAFLRRLHPRASDAHRATRLPWMLEEGPGGKIVWRFDKEIRKPASLDPPERTWAAFKTLRCPTLLVRGAVSDIVAAESVQKVAAAIPASKAVEIPEAGHMVAEDNPQAFNAAVLEFLAAQPSL
jgi:pimeloyl-ACP methyl ester carboxylesterase